MTTPGYVKQPIIQRLPTLLSEIRSGYTLVPRFQRPFIWKDQQRLDLLDSVYRGLPIGSIIVWRTMSQVLGCHDRLGPFAIEDKPREKDSVKQYLLDGHQRLTTLYAAFYDVDADAHSADTGRSNGRWPMYFDLQKDRFELHPHDGRVPTSWLPLSIVFAPYKLIDFQKALLDPRTSGSEPDKGRELGRKAEFLAETFKDYQIAVIPIVTEKLDVVTLSFQRINSAGTKMSEVHMVNALTWKHDFDFSERMERVRSELEAIGWGDLDEELILGTCKGLGGLDIYDSGLGDVTSAIEKDPALIEKAGVALVQAAHFLDERCNICGPAMLPYRLQVVFLACRLVDTNLTEELADALRQWVWISTYTEFFGPGINATKVRLEFERLQAVVERRARLLDESNIPTVKRLTRFDFRAARSRAMALRLAELGPRLASGKRFDAFRELGTAGHNAMPPLVTSRSSDSDTHIGESRLVLPPTAMRAFREFIRAPHQTALFDAVSERDVDEILASHGVTTEAAEAYANGDYSRFLALRRQRLLELEQSFVENLGLGYESTDVLDR